MLAMNPIDRYKSLKLKESLSDPSLYLFACNELRFLLRNGYSKSPKNLQSLIFEETLFAFSLLPMFQTQSAISAAKSLLQSAEFALPKQKRSLAITEYKHAVVACKRKSKMNQDKEQGLNMLSQDVLVHIFCFLDVQSLVSASSVCWSWNAAASDKHLWKSLYSNFFYNSVNVAKNIGFTIHTASENEDKIHFMDWRSAFKTAFKESRVRKLNSYRGYCSGCHSVVWLSSNINRCSNKSNSREHKILRVSKQQILEFILGGGMFSDYSSSDNDSDSEDDSILKMWAYPRQSTILHNI